MNLINVRTYNTMEIEVSKTTTPRFSKNVSFSNHFKFIIFFALNVNCRISFVFCDACMDDSNCWLSGHREYASIFFFYQFDVNEIILMNFLMIQRWLTIYDFETYVIS